MCFPRPLDEHNVLVGRSELHDFAADGVYGALIIHAPWRFGLQARVDAFDANGLDFGRRVILESSLLFASATTTGYLAVQAFQSSSETYAC